MRRRTLLATLPALACAPFASAHATEQAPVVASFSILADMTRRIGGDAVSVLSLVPVDGDAHQYQPTPDDLRHVHAARALVENGLGLEGWMTRMPQAAGFSGIRIIASTGVAPREMEEDGKTVTDPHAWQDPRNGVLYVRNIAAGLARALPGQAAAIQERARAYIAEIEETDRWIGAQFAAIPPAKRRILTSHDAFGYYGARYGIELLAVQGISTEGEPSAADIATLIGQIKREKIHAVFVENMTDPRLAATVARDSGAVLGPTVYSDALSEADGPAPTYLRMLRHNTTQFVAAMAGN
jgi:zinc/manganese transport system substrate-binding protein